VLTQLQVNYRSSPLSVEGVPRARGRLRAGDRIPDARVKDGQSRLHEVLAKPGVHLLLQHDAPAPVLKDGAHCVHVHRALNEHGLGVTAVRPDGYVGYRSAVVDGQLTSWLSTIGAR
jgi:hypothetical protein